MRCLVCSVMACMVWQCVMAQEDERFVWEAETAVSYKLFNNWSFNTSLGQRTIFYENEEGSISDLAFLEFNQFVTRRITPNIKASLGYKFRSVEPVDDLSFYENRVTQQLGWTHLKNIFRLVSRIRAEQRIRSSSFAQRYRYRISADLPLSGEKIDAREFYAVASSEFLYEAEESDDNTWENRLSGSLGYVFNGALKAELSATYRLEDITREVEERLFINTGLFINLR